MNWTHSCKRVAELLSLAMDEPLSVLDRLRLRIHLSMCDNCRNVEVQLREVKNITGGLFTMEEDLNPEPSEAKTGRAPEPERPTPLLP